MERTKLIEQIKALGRELETRAEEMVPNTDNVFDYSIDVDFDPNEGPTIDISFSRYDKERTQLLLKEDGLK